MRDMTEEEYAALDKRLTDTVPTLGRNGTGFFSREGFHVVFIDENTAKILDAKALADHKTPAQIISEMVQRETAAVV